MKNHENNSKNCQKSMPGFCRARCLTVLLGLAYLFLPLTVFAQEERIDLNLRNAGIEELLKEIQQQTGLDYIFNHEEIPPETRITIQVSDETVSNVLDRCLKKTQLSYKIVDGVIIITPKDKKELTLTQVIRGTVVDAETEIPLAFASVAIVTTDPMMGAVTDEQGNFRIEEVPVGRHNIKVSYVGYESQIIPELMVTTGKEVVLRLKMKETLTKMDQVVVKPRIRKDKALNGMSTVSARTFSVEEARRYAGGWDDPARVAASFAGVTTYNTRDNTIIIRGNSPKGLLWRVEGIEIPNPNHFANLSTFGGGGVSALSALVVDNSDFFTGAFPAEYGNAMSGVFDIKLRPGNNEKREYAFQIGTTGIDISSEGPFRKNSQASYLFNYRYSTLGLVVFLFPEDIQNFIPIYQDLCFKINMPTRNMGVFSLWGVGASDKDNFKAQEDTAQWETTMDRIDTDLKQGMGALGLNHRFIFKKKNAYLNTSLALSGDYMEYADGILGYDLERYDYDYGDISNYKYTLTSVYNHKFSAKHTNRTGFIVNNLHYRMDLQYAPVLGQEMVSIVDEAGASNLMQVFTQSKLNISENLLINAGLHASYFDMNKQYVIEPRLGITWQMNPSHSVSLAYGKHSRLEPLNLYFTKINQGDEIIQPNLDLEVSKTHHLVFSYDVSLSPNLRLKVEPYYQNLYDVPVIPDSNFSVLNMEEGWIFFNDELVNTGTGKNYGIDITMERFLKDGFYYLFTASLFDSKYTGDDGVEYNTRYNAQYVFNLLFGKEWIMGTQQNKILGINARLNYFGGKRTSPVNPEESALAQDVVYFYDRLYENKEPDKLHVNLTVNYRVNKPKYASIWSIQLINTLMAKEIYGYYFNYRTQEVEPWEFAVLVPNLSYKIEF